jgi:hypothetical protein
VCSGALCGTILTKNAKSGLGHFEAHWSTGSAMDPSTLQVGARLQARDRVGAWLDAKIVAERGEDDAREVKVHFDGFHKRYDEWIAVSSDKLLPLGQQTPDVYSVERLLGKRKRGGVTEYLCKWRDFGEEENSWEPEDGIAADLIEAFQEMQAPAALPPIGPYVLSQDDGIIDDSIADALVGEWVDAIGRKGAALLSHQREEWAAKKFFSMTPCPAWLYRALHRALRSRGQQLAGVLTPCVRACVRAPRCRTLPSAVWRHMRRRVRLLRCDLGGHGRAGRGGGDGFRHLLGEGLA